MVDTIKIKHMMSSEAVAVHTQYVGGCYLRALNTWVNSSLTERNDLDGAVAGACDFGVIDG